MGHVARTYLEVKTIRDSHMESAEWKSSRELGRSLLS